MGRNISRIGYSNRVFKKHSTIIAKLALKSGIIKPNFFNELYWAEFRRKSNKKGKFKLQYYTELYYGSCDYWGEWDEHSLMRFISDMFYWDLVKHDEVTGKIIHPEKFPSNNISIIKKLRYGVQHNKLQRAKTKHLSINRSNILGKRSRKNKVLRLRKYHY